MRSMLLAVLVAGLAGTAAAEVKSRDANGFTLERQATLAASPAQVYVAIGEPGRWWNPEHTYSGDAANLTLELRPGGCFCETLGEGGVEHGRVVLAWPERTVRLYAALGPLQASDPSAALTFEIAAEGEGARLTLTYVVAGAGVGALADPVDGVIGEQFDRLIAHADR